VIDRIVAYWQYVRMGVVLARCGVGCAVGATIFYLEEDQTWYQSTIIGGAVLIPAICHVNPQQTVLLHPFSICFETWQKIRHFIN
jgi:hypothetical protein